MTSSPTHNPKLQFLELSKALMGASSQMAATDGPATAHRRALTTLVSAQVYAGVGGKPEAVASYLEGSVSVIEIMPDQGPWTKLLIKVIGHARSILLGMDSDVFVIAQQPETDRLVGEIKAMEV